MGSQRVRHTLVAKQQHHHINSGNNHQGTVDQNHDEVSPHTCQIAYQKHNSKQVLMKLWRKDTLYIACGNLNLCSHYEKQYESSLKIKKKK